MQSVASTANIIPSLDHSRDEVLVASGERRESLFIGDENLRRHNHRLYRFTNPPVQHALRREVCCDLKCHGQAVRSHQVEELEDRQFLRKLSMVLTKTNRVMVGEMTVWSLGDIISRYKTMTPKEHTGSFRKQLQTQSPL